MCVVGRGVSQHFPRAQGVGEVRALQNRMGSPSELSAQTSPHLQGERGVGSLGVCSVRLPISGLGRILNNNSEHLLLAYARNPNKTAASVSSLMATGTRK